MLSLFRPRCPLNPSEKTWVEYRVSWLLGHLGFERLRQMEIILPTGEYFPLPYHGEPEQVQKVFEQVCRYMQVEPGHYRLNVFDDDADPRKQPHMEKWLVWNNAMAFPYSEGAIYEPNENAEEPHLATLHIHRAMALDLELVIAIFSRDISHSLLSARPDREMDQTEYQHTVELMPLFYGLGIFGANAVMRERAENLLGWHYWSMVPQGALPARYFGYAFALLCWLRQEPLPAWRSYLRRDAEVTLQSGLKYLEKTGDTILDREPSAKPYGQRSLSQWLDDLQTGTPGRRIAALWAIQSQPARIQPGEHIGLITENLSHANAVVRASTAAALDAIGETAAEAVPKLLVTALEDRRGSVRTVAALALGKMSSRADEIIPELLTLLRDRNLNVANAAAWSLGQFGHQAAAAGPPLVWLLRKGILHCDESTLNDILDALRFVTDHPEDVIRETLADRDAETCRRAIDLLKERQIDTQ